MYNNDILTTIGNELYDIGDIINYCYLTKNTRDNICSKKSFWVPIFNKNNFPIINEYHKTEDWITEFIKIGQVEENIKITLDNITSSTRTTVILKPKLSEVIDYHQIENLIPNKNIYNMDESVKYDGT